MTDPKRLTGAMLMGLLLLASCGPGPVPLEDIQAAPTATSPQFAPGDPCRGVVPELCPR